MILQKENNLCKNTMRTYLIIVLISVLGIIAILITVTAYPDITPALMVSVVVATSLIMSLMLIFGILTYIMCRKREIETSKNIPRIQKE